MRAPADRTPLPLDDDVIRKVAAIAKVPDSELAFFSCCIDSLVGIACGTARRHELWQASDLKSSAKRIAVAARELEAALDAASEGVKELVRLSMPHARPRSLNGHGEMVAHLAAGAETAAALRSSEPWSLFRRLVVKQLLSDAKHADGALSVTADGGTLFDALSLLFPYLPKDFEMSSATVRRIARGSKKAKNGTK